MSKKSEIMLATWIGYAILAVFFEIALAVIRKISPTLRHEAGADGGREKVKHMMTETDAMAASIAVALDGSREKWAQAQTERAVKFIMALNEKGEIDPSTFSTCIMRHSNTSALRQKLEKSGILKEKPDALSLAVEAAIERIEQAKKEAMKTPAPTPEKK